jgi:hypothetical protein
MAPAEPVPAETVPIPAVRAETAPAAETVPATTGRTLTLPFRRARTEDTQTTS